MKIFIDFDDVIFNTKKFKEDFENLFVKNGISIEIFRQHYYDPNDTRKIKIFDATLHAKRIQDATGINTSKLLSEINVFLRDASQYVFSDVVPFVKKFGSDDIYVVSFGGLDFLKKKIKGSRISDYMPNIKTIDYEKSVAIAELLESWNVGKDEKMFFLDDRVEQLDDVKEKFPNIITILLKRPEGRYQDMQKESCCDHEVHNLKEAQEIINKL